MANSDPYEGVRYLYHITHKDNIAGILHARALLHHTAAHRTRNPADISDPEVNQRRRAKVDPIYGRPLHDYVPLYFRARNPMLSVRRTLQSSIVVLYVNRCVLHRPGVVFTDGNAASGATRFFSDLRDLKKIDWECLNAASWTDFKDGKRKRCAEVLIPVWVPLSKLERAVVNNAPLRDELVRQKWSTPVDVRPDWFF